jgi:hypothetical protein
MTTDPSDAHRRRWNAQHASLRRLLEKDQNLPQAKVLFWPHHAAVHTARLDRSGGWSFQDEVLGQLTPAQMRAVPPGQPHSVAWLIWHITRIEDATLNGLLAGTPEVFFGESWATRLETHYIDMGNAMPAKDITQLSETVNLKALLAYRLAVGRRTRAIIRGLAPAALAGKPLPERLQGLADAGEVRPEAAGLLAYWGSHPATNLLLMPATRHGFVHLNEIRRLRSKLRQLA